MIKISEELKAVIQSSWFTVEKGFYVYTKVSVVRNPEKHLIVTQRLMMKLPWLLNLPTSRRLRSL